MDCNYLSNESVFNIYAKLNDEKSKEIFKNRLMYSLTKDYQYIINILSESFNQKAERKIFIDKKINDAISRVKDFYERPHVIFGAGMLGRNIKKELDFINIKVECFCDNSLFKQQQIIDDVSVISKSLLISQYSNAVIFIASYDYEDAIREELIDCGFNNQMIICPTVNKSLLAVDDQIEKQQYFEKDIIKVDETEVFIDGGGFNGDTTKNFIDFCNGKYEKVYYFEPNKEEFKLSKQRLNGVYGNKIVFNNVGVFSRKTKLPFLSDGAGSCVDENGIEKVDVVALDDEIEGKVTLIKLDVEGAELEALYGAKRIIQQYHPKLAICLYHRPEDIVSIPGYILSLDSSYKFYIRHYCFNQWETVLYAI